MAKKSIFECQHCGYQSTKWLGKCPECGVWDGFIESKEEKIKTNERAVLSDLAPTPITEVKEDVFQQFSSFESEFDIVLGGGITKGGLYLIGGSPGVGKSTLLLKISALVARSGKRVLYISGEESKSQIKLRAKRIGALDANLFLLSEIEILNIKDQIQSGNFDMVVADSIQTLYSSNLSASPGSISQVREITFELMRIAKTNGISIFIIGHITKDGSIAGPRVLEHMVDCVLYFEGDPSREFRILRGFKNRFGTTSEIGIFEMKNNGLISAKNASLIFFANKKDAIGSSTTVTFEGSRALILEIQALVSENSFGAVKRSATGFELNRLNMLIALLEKKFDIPLNRYDVFLNVAGGIKISETAADLAVVSSILSSFKNRPIQSGSVFIGEVSLIGDVREASNLDLRLKEMENYGFKNAIIAKKPSQKTTIKCFEISQITKLLDWM
ncbi:MAG: DNA repair protein RadA [Helicobacter sp.]|nr:DNA repair protein RadA [Helicobacter sp.]